MLKPNNKKLSDKIKNLFEAFVRWYNEKCLFLSILINN